MQIIWSFTVCAITSLLVLYLNGMHCYSSRKTQWQHTVAAIQSPVHLLFTIVTMRDSGEQLLPKKPRSGTLQFKMANPLKLRRRSNTQGELPSLQSSSTQGLKENLQPQMLTGDKKLHDHDDEVFLLETQPRPKSNTPKASKIEISANQHGRRRSASHPQEKTSMIQLFQGKAAVWKLSSNV